MLGLALKELLIEKDIVTPAEIRQAIEFRDSITPATGAKIVARAWTDPAYKQRLLANGTEAIKEFGLDMGATELVVVENTPAVHNMIVCTLCSCYPRAVLGLPPSWYKSREYRARAVREPRAVLREFGTDNSRIRSKCGCMIPRPTCAIWCCPCAPQAPENLDDGAIGGAGHARFHDRRQPAAERRDSRPMPRKNRGDRPRRLVQFHRGL